MVSRPLQSLPPFCAACRAVLLAAATATVQGVTGDVESVVTGPDGRPLAGAHINLIQTWFEELKAKVPPAR